MGKCQIDKRSRPAGFPPGGFLSRREGDRVLLEDMALYTMVKTNTFFYGDFLSSFYQVFLPMYFCPVLSIVLPGLFIGFPPGQGERRPRIVGAGPE